MTNMMTFQGVVDIAYLSRFLNRKSTVIQSCFSPLNFFVNLSCQDQVINWLDDLSADVYTVVLNSPDMHYMEISFTEEQHAVLFKLTFAR